MIVSVSDQLAFNQASKVTITEFAFAITTKMTAKILLICSFVITIRQLFGFVDAYYVTRIYLNFD